MPSKTSGNTPSTVSSSSKREKRSTISGGSKVKSTMTFPSYLHSYLKIPKIDSEDLMKIQSRILRLYLSSILNFVLSGMTDYEIVKNVERLRNQNRRLDLESTVWFNFLSKHDPRSIQGLRILASLNREGEVYIKIF